MADQFYMNLNNQPVKSKYIFDSRPTKTNYEIDFICINVLFILCCKRPLLDLWG